MCSVNLQMSARAFVFSSNNLINFRNMARFLIFSLPTQASNEIPTHLLLNKLDTRVILCNPPPPPRPPPPLTIRTRRCSVQ